MTVKELMERLQKYPDDYTIVIEKEFYNDDNDGYEHLYINEIYQSDYCKDIIIEV